MKSVLVCAFLLTLAHYGATVKVCNQDLSYDSTLTSPCIGNDVAVMWPNYNDFAGYYKCSPDNRRLEMRKCPSGKQFTYYFQQCTDCKDFIPPPKCEYLQQTTDVICESNVIPTPGPTTKQTTTSRPTTVKPTTIPVPTTYKIPVTKTTKYPSSVPTPPSQSTTSSVSIPMPPMVVTPVPGIPTPPNENLTPPSIPGTPPILTTIASA